MEIEHFEDLNSLREQMNTSLKDLIETNDPQLAKHQSSVLEALYESFLVHQVLPQKSILKNFYDELAGYDQLNQEDRLESLERLFRLLSVRGEELVSSLEPMDRIFDGIPVAQTFAMPVESMRIRLSEPWPSLWRKARYRIVFLFQSRLLREIPARHIAKVHLQGFLTEYTLQLLNSWHYLVARLLQTTVNEIKTQKASGLNLRQNLREECRGWLQGIQRDFLLDLASHTQRWQKTLNLYGTPLHALAQWSPKQSESRLNDLRKVARSQASLWQEKSELFNNRLFIEAHTTRMIACLRGPIQEKLHASLQQAVHLAEGLVNDLHTALTESQSGTSGSSPIEALETYRTRRLNPEVTSRLVRSQFRLTSQEIRLTLKKNLPASAEGMKVLAPRLSLVDIRDPKEATGLEMNLVEAFEGPIFLSFLPEIEEKLESSSNYLEFFIFDLDQKLKELRLSLLGARADQQEPSEDPNPLDGRVQEALKTVQDSLADFVQHILIAEKVGGEALAECEQALSEVLLARRFSDRRQLQLGLRGERFGHVHNWIHQVQERMHHWSTKFLQRHQPPQDTEAYRNLQRKLAARTLDTTTIRYFLDDTYSLEPSWLKVPSIYPRLFNLEPVREKRFFVTHDKKMSHFKQLRESHPQQAQRVLVLGERGMGKSSILNHLHQLILDKEVLRFDGLEGLDPLEALASLLSCSAHPETLRQRMGRSQTVILIDNFDHLANCLPVRKVEAFLEFIQASPTTAHWVFTLTRANFMALDRAFSVRSLFSKVIDLQPLDLQEARRLIHSRQRLSGLEISYPGDRKGKWFKYLAFKSTEDRYLSQLVKLSKGELRAFLSLWLRCIEGSDSETVYMGHPSPIEGQLPMIGSFSLLQKHILNQLNSLHQLPIDQLARLLGVALPILDSELHYLENCGLVRAKGLNRQVYEIPHHLCQIVAEELKAEEFLV